MTVANYSSWIKNCIFAFREQDLNNPDWFMFNNYGLDDGRLVVRMDGYAIIPVEEYRRLKGQTRLLDARVVQWTNPITGAPG